MTSSFLRFTIEGAPFQLFSASHMMALLMLVCSAVLLFRYREAMRGTRSNRLIRYSLVGILLLTEVAFQLWNLMAGTWSAAEVLPLQLCSVSLLLSIWMLVTKSYRLFEVTYFWGLGGAGQAMLTPELFYPFPHFRFFHFFIAHSAIILACLHMVWVEQYQLTARSVVRAIVLLNGLLVVALLVNEMTGGNYLFVARKPGNPSLIDYLGPYPWYILSLEGVALLLFLLLYFPFRTKGRTSSTSADLT